MVRTAKTEPRSGGGEVSPGRKPRESSTHQKPKPRSGGTTGL